VSDPTKSRLYKQAVELIQPELDAERERAEQRLVRRGLPVGGEAYTKEMNRVDAARGARLNHLALETLSKATQYTRATTEYRRATIVFWLSVLALVGLTLDKAWPVISAMLE